MSWFCAGRVGRVVAVAACVAILPTVTVAAPVDGLVLDRGGIGPLRFGASEQAVIGRLTAVFGPASFDQYIVVDGPLVRPEDPDDRTIWTIAFEHPVGRQVCWRDRGICATFGGAARTSLSFVGWVVRGPGLAMPFGLGVGSRLGDYPAIPPVEPDTGIPCTHTVATVLNGVELFLESTVPLVESTVVDGVNVDTALPVVPSQVFVTRLAAGDGNYWESCPSGATLPATSWSGSSTRRQ